ncbi:MAG: M20/M25/M40 family metallo-hydrolase, partial [Bacteroidetes bacterium]|nr:M20/M25/M40 family metallo-hydrolase [Bacteroidota bacterium]
MVGRAVVGLVVVLLFSLEGLGRDDESYLVAITIPGSADATQLERLRLPVYHQFEDVLITEVQTVELAILVSSGWKVAVLDENPDAGGYTLLSDQRGTLSADDVGSARILFKHRGGWILKDFDAAVIGVERHGLVAAPLRKTVWRFGAETIVSVAPARADQDSLMAQIVSNVNADTVRFFVQSLQDFGTRYYRSAQADAVADWIKGQFVRMGFTQVEIDSFLFDGTWQKNVIATLPAASPSDEVIVIGGHHDSITGVDPMHYAPGADDNASGTTAVLEIARVLRMMDYHPEVTVKFVTFAAEERGLHGSHDFAEKAVQSGMRIRLMINHDMISYTLSPVESSTLDVNHYSGSAGYRELAKLATQRFTIVGARNGDSNRRNSDSYSF